MFLDFEFLNLHFDWIVIYFSLNFMTLIGYALLSV